MIRLNQLTAARFDRWLNDYDPESSPTGRLTDVLRAARHWCDLHALNLGVIDRDAHLLYLSDLDDGGQP